MEGASLRFVQFQTADGSPLSTGHLSENKMEITLAVLTVISYVCEAWYYILKDIHNI
jgi:hypothetical protein